MQHVRGSAGRTDIIIPHEHSITGMFCLPFHAHSVLDRDKCCYAASYRLSNPATEWPPSD